VAASRAAVAVLAGLSFLVGGATGATVMHAYACRDCASHAPEKGKAPTWVEEQADRWTRALELEPGQRATLVKAISDVKPRYDEIYGEVRGRRRAVDHDFQARLRGCLSDEQRLRFDALIAAEELRRRTYYGTDEKAAPATVETPSCSGEPETQPTSQ
jgi:hypothetical protein